MAATKTSYSKNYTNAQGVEFQVVGANTVGWNRRYVVQVAGLEVAEISIVRTTARAEIFGVVFTDGTVLPGEFPSAAAAGKAAMAAR